MTIISYSIIFGVILARQSTVQRDVGRYSLLLGQWMVCIFSVCLAVSLTDCREEGNWAISLEFVITSNWHPCFVFSSFSPFTEYDNSHFGVVPRNVSNVETYTIIVLLSFTMGVVELVC